MIVELPVLPPGASVVAFGLLATLSWGVSDFAGGLTARRAALFGILVLSQVVGLGAAVVLALIRGEAAPAPIDIGLSALAGAAGSVGVAGLYRGLAEGRMGVVAPVTGVLAALVPVAAGVALQGLPAPAVTVGIVVAILAVVLVSRSGDGAEGPSGLRYALVAGVAIGLFNVIISRLSHGSIYWPLAILRVVEILAFGAVVGIGRRPWRLAAAVVPAVVAIGVLDMLGNAFFVLAAQAGLLAVAAVLSSLYPVVTVILASVLLHERVSRLHAIGIVGAAIAIALIAAGSVAT